MKTQKDTQKTQKDEDTERYTERYFDARCFVLKPSTFISTVPIRCLKK